MRRENGEESNAERLAWELFQKTGGLGYYMLWQDLKKGKRGTHGRD